jgi:polysaccharide export outer membrane protein
MKRKIRMKYFFTVSIVLLSMLLTGCTTKSDYVLFHDTDVANKDTTITLDNRHYEYKIMPHDRVSVIVYNNPEYGTTRAANSGEKDTGILVSSDGYITMPLVGRIHIANLTQHAAKRKLEKAFKSYNVNDAEVYLEVLNKKAYILGEVRRPGEVKLINENIGLIQMIAKAGGLTNAANRHKVVVMQKRKNKIRTKTIDMTGENSLHLANFRIYPNDTVYVTPNNMKPVKVGTSEVFGLVGTAISPATSAVGL